MIEFVKMSGSGNDFVIIDNRGGKLLAECDKPDFVRVVCARRTGIGADGVLFVENSEQTDFLMRYFNADGGEVEFCGNGARCIAFFAHDYLGMPSQLEFTSRSGIVTALVEDGAVSLRMPPATEPIGPKILKIDGEEIEYCFVNTGVPHVVIFHNNLDNAPVVALGHIIRNHELFASGGTNVDFIRVSNRDDADLEIRTYERGVEDETLACGTGVVAAALVAVYIGLAKFPVRIRVALPDILSVDNDGDRCVLSGKVSHVFTGIYHYEK